MKENEVDIIDVWNSIKSEKKMIISLTLIVVVLTLVFSLIIPKTYESQSVVQLANIKDMIKGMPYDSLESKTIIKSTSVLLPVINEFYEADDEMSIKKFIDEHLQVEVIGEVVGRNNVDRIPYLRIITRADEAAKAKEMNEMIIENFFSYVEPRYNKKLKVVQQDLNKTKEDIVKLKNDIGGLESNIDTLTSKQLSGEAISKVTLLRDILSNYKNRLNDEENRLINLKNQIANKKEFKVVSEPQIPLDYSEPNVKLNVGIAFIAALLFSVLLALLKTQGNYT